MLRALYFSLFLALGLSSLHAQDFTNPVYDSRTLKIVDIAKIKITEEYTEVTMTCTAPSDYRLTDQVYVYLMQSTLLVDRKTGKEFKLLKSEGIPMAPGKRFMMRANEQFTFKLYFAPIPKTATEIDILEDKDAPNAFNFFKILLKPVA